MFYSLRAVNYIKILLSILYSEVFTRLAIDNFRRSLRVQWSYQCGALLFGLRNKFKVFLSIRRDVL